MEKLIEWERERSWWGIKWLSCLGGEEKGGESLGDGEKEREMRLGFAHGDFYSLGLNWLKWDLT